MANYIRILPQAWNKRISMRFELLGCYGNKGMFFGTRQKKPLLCYFWPKYIRQSYTYVSIFFYFQGSAWKSQNCWFTPCRQLQGSLLHNVTLFHLHSTISSIMCVCLPSQYHAVIIRLPTKQYYLFVYFLEFSKGVSPKLITDRLYIFQNI